MGEWAPPSRILSSPTPLPYFGQMGGSRCESFSIRAYVNANHSRLHGQTGAGNRDSAGQIASKLY